MKDIATTRRENFQRLVKQLQGTRNTSIALDMNESQVSQLASDNIRKPMGSRLARRIEAKAGLPNGSLDMPTTFTGDSLHTIPIFTIPELEEGAALNSVNDFNSGRPYAVWDNSNPCTPRRPLFAVYAVDDALAGTVNERDLVIFEASQGVRPRPGSIVVAKSETGVVIRILKQTGADRYELIATSDMYAPIHLNNPQDVLGSMVEVRWFRPRPYHSN